MEVGPLADYLDITLQYPNTRFLLLSNLARSQTVVNSLSAEAFDFLYHTYSSFPIIRSGVTFNNLLFMSKCKLPILDDYNNVNVDSVIFLSAFKLDSRQLSMVY
jgi:hypothetical protein